MHLNRKKTKKSLRLYKGLREVFLPAPKEPLGLDPGRLISLTPIIKSDLSSDEALSLALLQKYLPDYPKVLLIPEGLELHFPIDNFHLVRFPAPCFASLTSYSAMMLTDWFYDYFSDFQYMLIYQTDCLILRHDMDFWMNKNASYLGAPFLRKNGTMKAIGNGGFSLRKISDHINVLRSQQLELENLNLNIFRQMLKPVYLKHFLDLVRQAFRHNPIQNSQDSSLARRFLQNFDRPEDEFWSFFAPFFYKGFVVPKPEAALGFAAESRPEHIAALNGGEPPMGGHAWIRHNRSYWEHQMKSLAPEVLEIEILPDP